MRDRYGTPISEGWLASRELAYAYDGKVPPPIVVDKRGIAREVHSDPCINWVAYNLWDTRACGHPQEVHEEQRFECELCDCGRYVNDGATE